MSKTVIGNINDTDAPPYTLSIGSVTTGAPNTPASAEIIGESPNQQLSLVIPKGEDGVDAEPYTLAIGSVTTGAPGSQAQATITTDETNLPQLNLVIPRGDTGQDGNDAIAIDTSNFARVVIVNTGLEARPGDSGGLVFWMDMRDNTSDIIAAMEPQDVRILPQGTDPISPVAPIITTVSLTSMQVGDSFSQQLTSTGTTPITYAVTSGVLPVGLTLTSTGLLSGTPTTPGLVNFTVTATNVAGTDTQAFSISVAAEGVTSFSIFSGDYPYDQTRFGDGGGTIKVGTLFYTLVDSVRVTGGRVWLESVPPEGAGGLTIWTVGIYNAGEGPGPISFDQIPLDGYYVTIPYASLHVGWNDVTFPTSRVITPDPYSVQWAEPHGVWIGYHFADGITYLHTPSPVADAIQADGGKDLYIPADTIASGSGNFVHRSDNTFDWSSALYGIDVIVEPV